MPLHTEHVQMEVESIFSGHDKHHPATATLWPFRDFGAVYKYSDLFLTLTHIAYTSCRHYVSTVGLVSACSTRPGLHAALCI